MTTITILVIEHSDGEIEFICEGRAFKTLTPKELEAAKEITEAISPILHKYCPGGIEINRDLE